MENRITTIDILGKPAIEIQALLNAAIKEANLASFFLFSQSSVISNSAEIITLLFQRIEIPQFSNN